MLLVHSAYPCSMSVLHAISMCMRMAILLVHLVVYFACHSECQGFMFIPLGVVLHVHVSMLRVHWLCFLSMLLIRVGWFLPFFYILNENQAEKCCIHCKSSENGKKRISVHWPLARCAWPLWSFTIQGSKKFFFTMRTYWGSKDAEFYVEFKNINFS